MEKLRDVIRAEERGKNYSNCIVAGHQLDRIGMF